MEERSRIRSVMLMCTISRCSKVFVAFFEHLPGVWNECLSIYGLINCLCNLFYAFSCVHCVEMDAGHMGCFQFTCLLNGPFHSERFYVGIAAAFGEFGGEFGGEIDVERFGQHGAVVERGQWL